MELRANQLSKLVQKYSAARRAVLEGADLEIVLHIGAHKTATTYIQRLLAMNEDVLAQHGVMFVPPARFRPASAAFRPRNWLLRPWRGLQNHGSAEVLEQFAADAHAKGYRRLVVSEENLIGFLDPVRSGSWLYDDAAQRLARRIERLGGEKLRVLFAVRSYADYLPSAYVEAIKLSGFVPFDDSMRQHALGQTRGWPEVIDEISQILPTNAHVTIWQYEAMNILEPLILEHFVGGQPLAIMAPLLERPQVGATQRALDHLHKLSSRGTRLSNRRIRKVLRATSKTKGHAGFDPWSAEERRVLSARYAYDLDRLAQRWGDSLLHPATEPKHISADKAIASLLQSVPKANPGHDLDRLPAARPQSTGYQYGNPT